MTSQEMWDELSEGDKEKYRKIAASVLSGLHWCQRTWDAWAQGTMSEDDFIAADEDEQIIEDAAFDIYDFMVAESAFAG